jgi:hypothetical protein
MSCQFRYAAPNIFLTFGILTTLHGDLWTWCGILSSYFLFGIFDRRKRTYSPNIAASADSFANFMLYLSCLLLLILAVTVFLVVGANYTLLAKDIFMLSLKNANLASGQISIVGALGAFTSLGMYYGMIGGTVAHELVHRVHSKKDLFIGRLLLAPLWDTGFAIEHVYGHHRYVATELDSTTAYRGENFYKFYLRSSVKQLKGAYEIEKRRLHKQRIKDNVFNNHFFQGQILSLMCLIIFMSSFGFIHGTIACFYTALVGRFYIRITDYITHYGLIRISGEPIELRHSWDCYNSVSLNVLYNLPLHSEHHFCGNKPFWSLKTNESLAPLLPCGYVSAGLIALLPPLWFKLITPKLLDWDIRLASSSEKTLLIHQGLFLGSHE